MTIRVTITKPGVTDGYGIAMLVGTTYTVEENFGLSLISQGRASDTDASLVNPGIGGAQPGDVVFCNAATLASPTAQMLASYNVLFAQDTAPFTRYQSNGTTLSPLPDFVQQVRRGNGITAIGFGDSLIERNFLNTATETGYLNYGYINVVNMLLGQPFNLVYNGGVIGDTTTQMLARIDVALAYRPKVVFINAGTNDNDSAANIIPRLIQIFSRFLAIGADVHYNCIAPRSSFSGSTSAAASLRINEWAQLYAQETPGLTVHRVQDAAGFLDATSTSYAPLAGNLETGSAVHWNSKCTFNIGTLIAANMSGLYSKGQRLISSLADAIAVDSNSNQLFQYGVLSGSSGTKTGSVGTAPSGTVPTGLDVDHTVAGTADCVCSAPDRADGIGKDLVLTIGGVTPAVANDKWMVRTIGNMSTGLVAGGTYQAECDITVASPVNLTSISMYVQAAVDGGSTLLYHSMRHSTDPVNYPSNFVGGSFRTPEFTLPVGTSVTTFHMRCEIRFTTAGGSAVVSIGRWSVRRIVD